MLGIAALALLAALVAAVGPASRDDAEYVWPPETISTEAPRQGWYAPLPLLNRVPASMVVRLPCGLSPPLDEGTGTTVLRTTRGVDPASLRVVLERETVRVRLGSRSLASVEWPASCPLELGVRDGSLVLSTGRVPLEADTPGHMPIVTGLFTELDLRQGEPPEVRVRTRAYATSWTLRQVAAGALAAVLACLAIVAVAFFDRRRPASVNVRNVVARAWRARTGTDAFVVGALVVWWILAPSLWDDGWIRAQQRSLADVGTVGFYYDHWGARLPLGHWFESSRSWLTGSTPELVFLRIPTLLVVIAAWFLCRWATCKSVGSAGALGRWVLAAAFLVGATAWTMTMRPEPFVALLAVASLTAMLSFDRRPRTTTLGLAVLAPAVAATIHTTGIVVAAPLIAGAPGVLHWLWAAGWERRTQVAGLVTVALAVAVVLFTLDSDVGGRLADGRLAQQSELHDRSFWQEYLRYESFYDGGAATPLRRLSLALLVLVVVALLTRRRASTGVAVLPARAVAVGLLLLAFVPSKWEWHIGALSALGAVAVASEVARLLREGVSGRRSSVRPAVALVAILEASYWAWAGLADAGPFDLHARSWSEGFSTLSWVVALVGVATLLVLVGRVKGEPVRLDSVSRTAGWAVVVVSFAALGTTAVVLAADAASAAWSPPRDHVGVLAGRGACGVTGRLEVEPDVARRLASSDVTTLVVPPVAPYFSCAAFPRVRGGLVEMPQLLVLQSTSWPLSERDSPFAAITDLYEVASVGRGPRSIGIYAVEDDSAYARADVIRDDSD